MAKISIFSPIANSFAEITIKVRELGLEAAIERSKYVEKYFAADTGENLSLRRLLAIKDTPLTKAEEKEDALTYLFVHEDSELEKQIRYLKRKEKENFFRDEYRRRRLPKTPCVFAWGYSLYRINHHLQLLFFIYADSLLARCQLVG